VKDRANSPDRGCRFLKNVKKIYHAEINLGATGIGQYIRQQVSREDLAAQVDFNAARQLYLVQYFEIAFNRKWRRRMSASALDLSNAYFSSGLSTGYYPGLDLSRSFFGVIYATLGGGAYIYRMGNGAPAQSNPWERLRLDANLIRRFFLSSTVENFHGDTMKFIRGFVDLGLRF